ncbi:MAG: lysine exporter LysO family protein [Firmicutes bacterium]|nr:lysine exporter LysO family protein [Bacillota bacterium]
MTFLILTSLILGIFSGLILFSPENLHFLPQVTQGALALLLFCIGFDLAQERDLFQKIKGLPKIAAAVPFLIALGSLLGTLLISPLLNLRPGQGALVGAGFGWYSLSALIIAQTYDLTLAALALLTNVFREILAILLIPLIAAKLGHLPALAPGGAAAMDVTLPFIARSTSRQTALLALYSGTVLSLLVPILIPLLIRLLAA